MLPEVYKPKERPWVNPYNATTEQLIDQVNHCPSGALTVKLNEEILKRANKKSALFNIQ
jgi:hypothetical protein